MRRPDLEGADLLFQEILEVAPDAAVVVDEQGTIVLVNAQAERLLGRPRRGVLRRPFTDFLREDLRAAERGRQRDILKGRAEATAHDLVVDRGAAGCVAVEATCAVIHAAVRPLLCLALRDISERRRLEEMTSLNAELERRVADRTRDLQKANAELEALNRHKNEVLGMVAHELANAVTPLELSLATLRIGLDGNLDAREARALHAIDAAVQRQRDFITDLLDSARLQAGRLELSPSAVDVEALFAEVETALAARAATAGVQLRFAAGGANVLADRRRLAQVLLNLVGNAIKFTPRGGHVDVVATQQNGSTRFCVADTGRGLGPNDAERLFQPFSRVAGSQEARTGSGLGLFIAKGIVEQHGGAIWVESDGPGRGARFYAEIPTAFLQPKARPNEATYAAAASPPSST